MSSTSECQLTDLRALREGPLRRQPRSIGMDSLRWTSDTHFLAVVSVVSMVSEGDPNAVTPAPRSSLSVQPAFKLLLSYSVSEDERLRSSSSVMPLVPMDDKLPVLDHAWEACCVRGMESSGSEACVGRCRPME